jgi:hypothetical protein
VVPACRTAEAVPPPFPGSRQNPASLAWPAVLASQLPHSNLHQQHSIAIGDPPAVSPVGTPSMPRSFTTAPLSSPLFALPLPPVHI